MKAIVYTKHGTTDVLELKEIEKTIPKNDEGLIKDHNIVTTSMKLRLQESVYNL